MKIIVNFCYILGCLLYSMRNTRTNMYAMNWLAFFSVRCVFYVCLLVFCHLWSRSSEPRCLLQTKRHWTGQTGSMWCSPASWRRPAMPNCRMHPLHLGHWRMGRSKYRLILSLSSYLQPPAFLSPSVRKMNRCLTILLRFFYWLRSLLFLSFSEPLNGQPAGTLVLSCVNCEGFGDNHQSAYISNL